MLIGNSSTLVEEEVLLLLIFIGMDNRYAHYKPIFSPPEWDKNHLWVLSNSSWIMRVSSLAIGQFQTLYECQALFLLILSGDSFLSPVWFPHMQGLISISWTLKWNTAESQTPCSGQLCVVWLDMHLSTVKGCFLSVMDDSCAVTFFGVSIVSK